MCLKHMCNLENQLTELGLLLCRCHSCDVNVRHNAEYTACLSDTRHLPQMQKDAKGTDARAWKVHVYPNMRRH